MHLLNCVFAGFLLLSVSVNGLSVSDRCFSRQRREENEGPTVTTRWSKIQGFVRKVAQRNVAHFWGIPYAFPPVGPLRFKPPLPLVGRHRGLFRADKFRSACSQTRSDEKDHAGATSSENCLFINVYSPWDDGQRNSQKQENLRPVLVFIHGSGYVYGSSANPHMYGGYLASMGDLVFVIFNYRLGALGHAYGGNEDMPGNAGLYDQKMALQWIQDNIRKFGGDPNRVTAMGHSAGATYQTIHMFSNATRNLFHSAMIMSGNSCERNGLDSPEEGLSKTRKLAERVDCLRSNEATSSRSAPLTKEEVECLRRTDARKLVNAQLDLKSEGSRYKACQIGSFLPVYGTDFLPKSSDEYLSGNDFRKNISLLMGKVPVETSGIKSFSTINEAKDYVTRKMIATLGTNIPAGLDDLIQFYFASAKEGDRRSISSAVVQAINDLCNHCPTIRFAKEFAKTNKVYLYYYTYMTEKFREDGSRPYGPMHADDTRLLFGLPFKDYDEYGDEDREMSVKLIKLWSKFVHEDSMPWPEIGFVHNQAVPFQFNISGHESGENISVDPDDTICRLL